MSRSFKKAIITISKKLQGNAHRVVRRRVKEQLRALDVATSEDDDLAVIEADTRELGLEEWGTKLGMEFESIDALSDNEEDREEWRKYRRKERRK